MQNGKAVSERLRKGRTGGIPWIAMLDSAGNELATSDGPDGNIGCPVQPSEIEHFMRMISQSDKGYTPGELVRINKALKAFAQQFRN